MEPVTACFVPLNCLRGLGSARPAVRPATARSIAPPRGRDDEATQNGKADDDSADDEGRCHGQTQDTPRDGVTGDNAGRCGRAIAVATPRPHLARVRLRAVLDGAAVLRTGAAGRVLLAIRAGTRRLRLTGDQPRDQKQQHDDQEIPHASRWSKEGASDDGRAHAGARRRKRRCGMSTFLSARVPRSSSGSSGESRRRVASLMTVSPPSATLASRAAMFVVRPDAV
jgi:hypothetical protein